MVLAMSYALNEQVVKLEPHEGQETVVAQSNYASPSQKRLAEITEMIHTASLFHDDVIDKVFCAPIPSTPTTLISLKFCHIECRSFYNLNLEI